MKVLIFACLSMWRLFRCVHANSMIFRNHLFCIGRALSGKNGRFPKNLILLTEIYLTVLPLQHKYIHVQLSTVCETETCVARHYIIAATDNSLFTIRHSISRLYTRWKASPHIAAKCNIYVKFGHTLNEQQHRRRHLHRHHHHRWGSITTDT